MQTKVAQVGVNWRKLWSMTKISWVLGIYHIGAN
jgi:hypothetical protein